MFKGFVNRMYNGNPNRPDYNKEDMPETRWQLFWVAFKARVMDIFYISLMISIFALPTLIWTFLNVAAFFNALEAGSEVVAQQTITMYLLILIPCLGIFSMGLGGATYVLRNWARDEPATAWSDFWYGFRRNWLQALLVGLIDGAAIYLLRINVTFYSTAFPGTLGMMLSGLMIALGLLLALVNVFLYPLMVTYELSFGKLWRNGVLLMLARLPHVIGFLLIALLPLIATLFSGVLYFLAIYILYGFGFFGLMLNSFTNAVFDKFINPNVEGAVVGQGLRQDDDDEYEDEFEFDDDEEAKKE